MPPQKSDKQKQTDANAKKNNATGNSSTGYISPYARRQAAIRATSPKK